MSIYKYPFSDVFMTASSIVGESVSFGRLRQKSILTRTLLGDRKSFSTVQVITDNVQSEAPSVTQIRAGVNHYYVTAPISASQHEVSILNAYNSGSTALETTAVPDTGTLFYSKERKLQTVTYKYKASSGDGGWDSLLGSQVSASNDYNSPKTFTINVNETGKLVNIRVWIELVHKSSSGLSSGPLADLGISLRCPNLSFGHAHPLRNSKEFDAWTAEAFVPSNFYRDTFILWEGNRFVGDSMSNASFGYTAERYTSWDYDRGMRVVFDDSSPILNPRHLRGNSPASTNTNGAPHAAVGTATGSGVNVPWFSETAIAGTGSNYGAAGSPPQGWLSAPGGVAAADEWATTGSNYGAHTIKPVYPLLDNIWARKLEKDVHTNGVGSVGYGVFMNGVILWTDWDKWRGYRPGLRGVEISGSWQVLFAIGSPNDTAYQMPAYVRQVRLEITYEKNQSFFPLRGKQKSDKINAFRPGKRTICIVSGTDSSRMGTAISPDQDYFKNEIYVDVPQDNSIGRTFGVILNSGSINSADFALYYSVTGVLGAKSGSSPWWLLNSEFGTPSIPISSSSLDNDYTESQSVNTIASLNPSTNTTEKSIHVVSMITNPQKRLEEIALDFSGSQS